MSRQVALLFVLVAVVAAQAVDLLGAGGLNNGYLGGLGVNPAWNGLGVNGLSGYGGLGGLSGLGYSGLGGYNGLLGNTGFYGNALYGNSGLGLAGNGLLAGSRALYKK